MGNVMKKNLNELLSEEKANLMKQEFEKISPFEELFPGKSYIKMECKEFYYKFRNKIEELLIQKEIVKEVNFPLEELHLHISQDLKDYNFNDGVNKITTLFYENDQELSALYLDFIKEFVKPNFKFPFYFQAIPTIRIHCPNAKNSNHYPRYHTDIGYGHPAQEINFWLNLTEPFGHQKHGFRIMNLEDSLKLYRSYNYNFANIIKNAIESTDFNKNCETNAILIDNKAGEILAMDSRCFHSGEPLINHTRISIDIRIISVEEYSKLPIIYQGAGRMKILFAPGYCYHNLNSNLI
jgi:hypothetical protein